jgi:hypothetical protein
MNYFLPVDQHGNPVLACQLLDLQPFPPALRHPQLLELEPPLAKLPGHGAAAAEPIGGSAAAIEDHDLGTKD